MKIKIKIMPNDSDTIAKVVIIDAEYRVLMLKRSKYLKKYPDKWDLPRRISENSHQGSGDAI